MNREEAKRLLSIIQAFADGKTVQFYSRVCEAWQEADFDCLDVSRYRIKPEPKLRPWKPEEAPKVFVVTGKGRPGLELRVVRNGKWADTDEKYDVVWGMLLAGWLRIAEDGTTAPCGVMSEEA